MKLSKGNKKGFKNQRFLKSRKTMFFAGLVNFNFLKKIILICSLVIFSLIILLGILYFSKDPNYYYCGLEDFGGPKMTSHPDMCYIEKAKMDKYFQFCIELVDGTENSWEGACSMVLQDPSIICIKNIAELGLDISEGECLKRLYPVLGELYETEEIVDMITVHCKIKNDCCEMFNKSVSCNFDCIDNRCAVMKIV